MELALHLGAHATDDGLIAQWLTRNADTLGRIGVAAPPASVFVPKITEAVKSLRGRAAPELEEGLLREMGASGQRKRMVVSAPGLLGPVQDVVAPEGFYTKGLSRRIYGLRQLFPRCKLSFYFATRRADVFLPRILRAMPETRVEDILPLLPDEALPWSQLASDLRAHAPGASLTIWRHEDLGQVWPQVLRFLLGEGRSLPANGLFEIATVGLSAQARLRVQRYLAANPPATVPQLARVVSVFREKYGSQSDASLPNDLPEWARLHIQRLARGYDTEWEDIAHIPGVRPLAP